MSGPRASSRSEVPRTAPSSTPPAPRGSAGKERLKAAGVRAIDAHTSVIRAAKKVTAEMEEVTATHGIPTTDLDAEDSLVVQLVETREKLTTE